jgi:hypothetical protein
MPIALRDECLRVGHGVDVAQGPVLVRGMLVIRFHDAVADPVAEVSGAIGIARSAIVVAPLTMVWRRQRVQSPALSTFIAAARDAWGTP